MLLRRNGSHVLGSSKGNLHRLGRRLGSGVDPRSGDGCERGRRRADVRRRAVGIAWLVLAWRVGCSYDVEPPDGELDVGGGHASHFLLCDEQQLVGDARADGRWCVLGCECAGRFHQRRRRRCGLQHAAPLLLSVAAQRQPHAVDDVEYEREPE